MTKQPYKQHQQQCRDTAKFLEGFIAATSLHGSHSETQQILLGELEFAKNWMYRISAEEHICGLHDIGCPNGPDCNVLR